MKSTPTEFSKAFDVIIQFGAILAVLVLYYRRFKWDYWYYKKIALAFLPTAVLGFLFKNKIELLMESTTVVAVSLIVGGIILIFIDRFLNNSKGLELSDRSSFLVGVVQSIAMVPGVSRSAATIIGGRILGLNSEKAAEFSFILAVPTLTAASLYKLWKIRDILEPSNAGSLGLGVLFSFIFSIFAIKFFISVVNKHGFKYFGIYRIIVGMTVLIFSFYEAI